MKMNARYLAVILISGLAWARVARSDDSHSGNSAGDTRAAVDELIKSANAGSESIDVLASRIQARGSGIIPVLSESLKTYPQVTEGDKRVRKAIIAALGFKDPRATEPLCNAVLKGTDVSEQLAALASIEKSDQVNAIQMLVPGLNMDFDSYETPAAIGYALTALASSHAGRIELINALSEQMKTANERYKLRLIGLIGTVPSSETADFLFNAHDDQSMAVKCRAIQTLGMFHLDSAHQFRLIGLLRIQSSPDEVRAAARALGNQKCVEAIPDLIKLLADVNRDIAKDANEALVSISGTRQPNDAVTWTAWYESQRKTSAEDFKRIAEALKVSGPQKPVIIEQLANFPFQRRDVGTLLLNEIRANDFRSRAAACHVLGEINEYRALKSLVAALRDPSKEVSSTANRALIAITGSALDGVDAWDQWLSRNETLSN